MPASIDSTVSGYVSFTVVKLIGYSLFSLGLNRCYKVRRKPLVVGGARTLLGMALGSLYFLSWRSLGVETHTPFYWIGLLPLRVFEWWILIHIFYDRGLRQRARGTQLISAGIGVSYILDIPAALGYLLCGMSIC